MDRCVDAYAIATFRSETDGRAQFSVPRMQSCLCKRVKTSVQEPNMLKICITEKISLNLAPLSGQGARNNYETWISVYCMAVLFEVWFHM